MALPPELIEEILSWVTACDVISFGATCHAFHELSMSQSVWRKLCHRQAIKAPPPNSPMSDWRRTAILKYSQALYLQTFSRGASRPGVSVRSHHGGRPRYPAIEAVSPPLALGYRRAMPTRDHLLLWDHQGTLFVLHNSIISSVRGWRTTERASIYSVLCHYVKDFAVDPRSDISFRQYVYVLARHNNVMQLPDWLNYSGPASACDCVDVYKQDNSQRVFRMTFHPSLNFTQIRLTGSELNRVLLLLTDSGLVYALSVNESQLMSSPSYTVQLTLRKISTAQPCLPIQQLYSSYSSALYVTVEGAVYIEVHSAGVYRQLFGTQQGFDRNDVHSPLPLSLPYKVVKCSIALGHLCLLDEGGRLFVMGNNRHGQLGTGDKMDRGEPTQVALTLAPVDVFCGLNHTLALLQGESGDREVQGCGCGEGGRLPGCPKGTAVFLKLAVKVPRTARSLCASKDCLYLLCCHDVTEPPVFQAVPLGREEERTERAERERLQNHLSEIRERATAQEQLETLRGAVRSHMTLNASFKDFLNEALIAIQNRCGDTD
ncbi:F-box only protein 24-like [Chanos chanos]|uniref:F-box only protein 24-like n=1 Tax=Chanos chanos TaxID=29144 RepID=A0A6J2VTE4_CHACN|nr:F-box only protein 24 [Chanos chanos]